MSCYFNGCNEPTMQGSVKCAFHKNRGTCRIADCRNQVYARHLCVGHGGRKPCQTTGCHGNARVGGFCNRHGAKRDKPPCAIAGCMNSSYSNGHCIRHGGRRQCKIQSCQTHARTGGYCWRHGRQTTGTDEESETSSLTSSPRSSQSSSPLSKELNIDVKSIVFVDYAALDASILDCVMNLDINPLESFEQTSRCRIDGCETHARAGGFCWRHRDGDMTKPTSPETHYKKEAQPSFDAIDNSILASVCSFQGCRNQVYARMLCVGHGGRKPCIIPNCRSSARVGPYCCRHGPGTYRKLCDVHGCQNVRHTGGKCIRHGGGRRCRLHGCDTHARTGGYCWRHRDQGEPIEPKRTVKTSKVDTDLSQLIMDDNFENELLDEETLNSYFNVLCEELAFQI
ncbi:hypothetical protein THRCLA_21505 [Thraustotheca clavata]|uniref:WRKY transcription factor 19 n=1 Tax=Thraustotheca clavata TaxID=74557 RepID=A0A1V9ZVT1_9STRA|nr:hypothetical protein THRCLA_21505 [Thraustotheca clavata]